MTCIGDYGDHLEVKTLKPQDHFSLSGFFTETNKWLDGVESDRDQHQHFPMHF